VLSFDCYCCCSCSAPEAKGHNLLLFAACLTDHETIN
jgi:hypothetical protein